jgi:hypothetical protein
LCVLTQFPPKIRWLHDDNSTEPGSAAPSGNLPGNDPTNQTGMDTIMPQALPDLYDPNDQRIKTIRMLLEEDAYVINFEHLVCKVIDFEIALGAADNDPI